MGVWLFSYEDFNPRTHEECDINDRIANLRSSQFQSTHSRGVRHFDNYAADDAETISIHALTRSATGGRDAVPSSRPFQSTHSRGVRRYVLTRTHRNDKISIHALTRSATANVMLSILRFPTRFQSTHSRGVRPRIIAIINEFMYNSTD